MQINIEDIWSSAVQQRHSQYVQSVLDGSLPAKDWILNQLLNTHATSLAISCPATLRIIIQDVERWKLAASPADFGKFHSNCKRLFDYGSFAAKDSKQWNAYALCRESSYRLCPYCQLSLAVTIYRDRKEKALRPTLDHFYPKHLYPYLALSLFNLVPSCYACNSSLKGTSDFFRHEHLHPFEDPETIKYELDFDSYIEHRRSPQTGAPPSVKIATIAKGHPHLKKAQRSIKTFAIGERLELSAGELHRFVETLLAYGAGRLEEANQRIFSKSPLPLSEDSALGFSRNGYKNEWLGAIKRDLYDICWSR